MALETVVFQQDPYSCKDPWFYSMHKNPTDDNVEDQDMEYYSSSVVQGICEGPKDLPAEISANSPASSENGSGCRGGFPSVAVAATGRRKRRRARVVKDREDVESQRRTHIAVERNRRRQMNDYLTVLRSMMPPSYVQRVSADNTFRVIILNILFLVSCPFLSKKDMLGLVLTRQTYTFTSPF